MNINWYGLPMAMVWTLLLVAGAVVATLPLVGLVALAMWAPPVVAPTVVLALGGALLAVMELS